MVRATTFNEPETVVSAQIKSECDEEVILERTVVGSGEEKWYQNASDSNKGGIAKPNSRGATQRARRRCSREGCTNHVVRELSASDTVRRSKSAVTGDAPTSS